MKNYNIIFLISFIVAVGLMVGGFFVPPTGVIDGSVLTASGILLGFATCAQLPTLIHGREVKIKKGEMTIELGDNDEWPRVNCNKTSTTNDSN